MKLRNTTFVKMTARNQTNQKRMFSVFGRAAAWSMLEKSPILNLRVLRN